MTMINAAFFSNEKGISLKELIPEDPVLGFVRAVTHVQKETVVIGQFIEHRICVPDPVVQQKSIGVQGMRDGSFRILK